MIDYPQDRGVDRAHVGFTPKSGHSVGQLDVGKRPKSNSDALDIAHCRTNLLSVGLDRSRPAYPRHFCTLARLPGEGLLAKCLSLSLSSGCGTGFRAFDNRP